VQGYNEKQHLYVKAAADVFLDTPSYNAHSTGCDVLWSGTPLLTAPGDKMGARVAASLVAAAGCSATVARNEKDYAALAGALAARPHALRAAKECVRRAKVPDTWSHYRPPDTWSHYRPLGPGDRPGWTAARPRRALPPPPPARRARALVTPRRHARRPQVESPLFDTPRWVRDQERALRLAADVALAFVDATGAPGARDFHIVGMPGA
jgi:hypothetical protein